ncbi:ExeM/NucH family extracellular endonuclease [Marinomonas transparens]|uniref:ExeM/NucH family extracellular endonuclease n=1 Tax=Marinomonas transparens TaxID=2795388 RepID=A0A934JPS6_9GAMM|nr:ExeM/NucH family extracellular endonuclease [Marinomonas transparens]MBJ7536192.1 ExeM/NucH family extracellular endonuclease [Marinomonas transparens]
MKQTPLVLFALSGLAITPVVHADLLISEYVEGSGYNKALELYNSGSSSVNLSDYELVRYINGSTTNSVTIELPDTDLAADTTYVLVETNSNTSADLIAKADLRKALGFNGNDPIALIRKADDSTIDFFGSYGGSNFAKDSTYARQLLTPYDSTSWTASDWSISAKNDFSGLGLTPSGEDNSTPVVAFSCEGQTLTPIYDIQGNEATSPLKGETLYTSGVVTQIVSSLYKGAFIQDLDGDGDSTTSDGLFVYSTSLPADVQVGDLVCVEGEVKEYFNFTQLALEDSNIEVLSSGNMVEPTYLSLSDDELLHDQLEAYESMLVTTSDSGLVVSRNFSFDYDSYRNNMVLSLGEPLYKSTHLYVAGSDEEQALAAANTKSTLFVDSDAKASDGVVPYFSGFNAEDGYIRVGDEVENLEGVIGYSYSQYRLVPTVDEDLDKSDFVHRFTERTAYGPELDKTGDLRVASFNVLNLFNSPFGGAANAFGDNRGATVLEEYQLQLTKISNAISQLDADIIGLMEIENNGFSENSAIAALVDSVNMTQPASAHPYAYVAVEGVEGIGTDAISVGMLYRPAVVQPKHAPRLIEMPEQHGVDAEGQQFDKYQRTALAQTFVHMASHKKITVAVNHFKSKGSSCIEDSNAIEASPQSNCNAFRVSAAIALGDALKRQARGNGNVLILGDLNAYGKEDPIRVLTDYDAANTALPIYTAEQVTLNGVAVDDGESVEVTRNYGYTNIVPHFQGDKSFSYSYDGELGGLDHALASRALMRHIVAADDWHINSVESNLFEYSSRFTGDLMKSENAYSSSDHDPVVIELQMKKRKKVKHFWGHKQPHRGFAFGHGYYHHDRFNRSSAWGWWR